MKIALCQMNVVAKRPDLNVPKMIDMMREAASKGTKVVCFSELCIPGYMVGDLWEDTNFIKDCIAWEENVTQAADTLGVTVIYGTVRNGVAGVNYEDGRQIRFNSVKSYNKADFLIHSYDKVNLPNYREFEDKRYFAQGEFGPQPCNIGSGQDSFFISTTACEDGWDDDYKDKPVKDAFEQLGDSPEDPHFHFNLSCSPYTKGKNGARNRRFAKHSELFAGLFYVNCVGIQNNGKDVFIFDGSTTAYSHGKVYGALPPLKECIGYVEVYQDGSMSLVDGPWLKEQDDPTLSEVLVYGTKMFLQSCGIHKVVIGLSGGIDSALSAMIHVKAVGAQNVVLVNMPTQYNSNTTKGIAADIAKNLGCPYMVIPVGELCDSLEHEVFHGVQSANVKEYKVDSENIAARMRGAGIQAALAAGLKAVFPNNGNKSELTVGYCVSPKQYSWTQSKGFSYLEDIAPGDLEKEGNNVLQVSTSVKGTKFNISTILGDTLECSGDHLVKVIDKGSAEVSFTKAEDLDKDRHLVCYRVGGNLFGKSTHIGNYNHKRPSWDYRSTPMTFPQELTEDISTFLGVCVADGSYGTANVYSITSTKNYVHDFIRRVGESLGLPESAIANRKDKRYGVLGIRISNSQFVGWLKWLGVKNGAGVKDIPPCIRKAPASFVKAFLSGLLLDSSCNNGTTELREITYHSGSEDLVDFVHQSLLNLGVLNYKRVRDPLRKELLPRWEVYIPSEETELLISLLKPLKESLVIRGSLNKSRKKHKGAFDFVYGHREARIQLARFLDRKGIRANSLRSKEKVSRPIAIKWLEHPMLNTLKEDNRVSLDLFNKFKEDTLGVERYFPIRDITKEEGSFPMMDLSMSSSHEFIANGMVVHNCTLYGDVGGYMAPLADLWKYEVYEVAKQLSDEMGGILPEAIFSLKPSAELSDDHNVEKGKGDPLVYWYHDKLLASWMEPWSRRGIEGTLQDFKDGKLLLNLGLQDYAPQFIQMFPTTLDFIKDAERWWTQFNQSVFKRVQAPPVLVVSRRAYGFDFRESMGGVVYTSAYLKLKELLLQEIK